MRIFLFLTTNLAVIVLASITLSLLGIETLLAENGIDLDLSNLLAFCAVFGAAGSLFSLLISKWLAKMATATQIIEQPRNADERWLVQTVQALASDAGIGEHLLAFYDFPAEHWIHLRTTNPIESTCATVRLRTAKTRNCGSRETTLAMAFQLLRSAQRGWRRITGFDLLELVVHDVEFKDGERQDESPAKVAA